jgi:hypothetical protein
LLQFRTAPLPRDSHDWPAAIWQDYLRGALPHAQHILLEDPTLQDSVFHDPRILDPRSLAPRSLDPRSSIEILHLPVILDEIQNTPQRVDFVRTLPDAHPAK